MTAVPVAEQNGDSAHESAILRQLRVNRRVGCCRIRFPRGKYIEIEQHPRAVPRRRYYFSSPTAAYRKALEITKEVREHGRMSQALSTGQRYVATTCFLRLGKIYDEDPTHLLRIVDDHLAKHPLAGNARTLDDVSVELIAKKEKIGRSERHLKGLDYKLRTLITALGNKVVTDVTTADLEDELERHPDWVPTTIHSTVQGWKILFNFAKRRGYIVENPADRLELPKIIRGEPTTFLLDDVKRLMASTLFSDRDPLLPHCQVYLALGLFAGLRPYEIARLKWGDVDMSTATIRIKAAAAKDRDRRIVDMMPNLVEWLRPHVRTRGSVLTYSLEKVRVAARSVLGLKEWPNDIMRHTYVSYYFAHCQSEAETKKQIGHRDDGRVFYNHYMVPKSRQDARIFWGIFPPVALLAAA